MDPAPGEEGKSVEEVLSDLERAEKEALDKTLPSPPVPSGQASRRASGVLTLSNVFGLQAVTEKHDSVFELKAAKSVLRPMAEMLPHPSSSLSPHLSPSPCHQN